MDSETINGSVATDETSIRNIGTNVDKGEQVDHPVKPQLNHANQNPYKNLG